MEGRAGTAAQEGAAGALQEHQVRGAEGCIYSEGVFMERGCLQG